MSLTVTIRRYYLKQSAQRWADISIAAEGAAPRPDANILVVHDVPPPIGGVYGTDCVRTLLSVASRPDMSTWPLTPPEVTEADPHPNYRAASVSLSCNTENEMLDTLAALLSDIQDNLTYVQGYPTVALTVVQVDDV